MRVWLVCVCVCHKRGYVGKLTIMAGVGRFVHVTAVMVVDE